MIEVETKISVDELELQEIIKSLSIHGEFLEVKEEEDTLFTSIREEGFTRCKTLKVRKSGSKLKIIFKSKRQTGEFKESDEVEVEVISDLKSVVELLNGLGFKETIKVRKRRTTYRVGECFVHLDFLEGLGHFVEVEALTEAGKEEGARREIRRVVSLLGLPRSKVIPQAYGDMFSIPHA